MNKTRYILQTKTLIVFALLVCGNANNATATTEQLNFGSVAMDIPAVMHQRLQPLTRYLSQSLGMPVKLKLSPNMTAAIKDTATGSVDLAYLTPVAYLKARAAGNARLIAKTVTKGKGSFRLMIVVKKDSPIKSIGDLRDKRFAFGDKAALLQRATVVDSGIKLKEFKEYRFIGHYDNIVRGVLNGDFDAGILKDTMAYKWETKGIRILHQSPDLPPYNITASKNMSEEMLLKVQQAFIKLDINNPNHRKIIHAVDKKYSGFAKTADSEYDIVRKLIDPFDE